MSRKASDSHHIDGHKLQAHQYLQQSLTTAVHSVGKHIAVNKKPYPGRVHLLELMHKALDRIVGRVR